MLSVTSGSTVKRVKNEVWIQLPFHRIKKLGQGGKGLSIMGAEARGGWIIFRLWLSEIRSLIVIEDFPGTFSSLELHRADVLPRHIKNARGQQPELNSRPTCWMH